MIEPINGKYTITHMGKSFTTIHYSPISDERCNEIRNAYFALPPLSKTINQMIKLKSGGKMINLIIDRYIKSVMTKARLSTSKWSISELFECNDLIRFLHGKITNCSDFYNKKSEIGNIKSVLRLSPSGTAAKVSNFPYKTMIEIFSRYNTNGNYYDFSCGWAVRMLAAMSFNINYFGTDPNHELVECLKRLSLNFTTYTDSESNVDISCRGSEKFNPSWINKMGLAFSSPPYFNLEDYRIGNQSTNERSYSKWLSEYWKPTVENIYKYLTLDGYFLLNMKNIKGYNTLNDMQNIIESNGFVYVESFELKNINRVILRNNNINTNELILVFKKSITKQTTLF
jgi:hypothetical protein